MTHEEAIEVLTELAGADDIDISTREKEAIQMGIEALETESTLGITE